MARSLLVRGMLAGVAAGIVAFIIARLFGESAVAQAIAVEGAHAHAMGEAQEPELISRGIQSTIGLFTAVTVFGIGLGGIYALVFGALQGRFAVGARSLAAIIAAAGFVVIYLVPFIKYPANPPAVGNHDTIGRRTALYFIMVALSLLVAVLAVLATRALQPRFGTWNAVTAGAGLFIVVIGLVSVGMPSINEVGADFPATTLYHFRLASVGTQLGLWSALGLLFGYLTERSLRPAPAPATTALSVSTPA